MYSGTYEGCLVRRKTARLEYHLSGHLIFTPWRHSKGRENAASCELSWVPE